VAVGGVALGGQNADEIVGGENALGCLEAIVAEEGVDALGDLIGVEDVGVLQERMVAEAED